MKKELVSLLIGCVAGLVALPQAKAVTCYAVNESNTLYRFDSATPSTTTTTAITGLPVGYRIVGLDFRTTKRPGGSNPGVGSLWALGTNGTTIQVFSVNVTTGAASLIGTLSGINTSGSDNGWFFGFNPATDTLRVMNFIYNYEVNPNTLAVTAQTQFDEATNPNNFPALNGSAYTTAGYGGSSQIYFLEQNNDGLNTSANISTGEYSAFPMPSNVAFSQPAGLDIDGSLMLMSGFDSMTNQQRLFSVNRSNGTFTPIGPISGSPAALSLRALAIQPTSFPPNIALTVKIKGSKKVVTDATSRVIKGSVKSNGGVDSVEYRVGTKGKYKKVKGSLTKWKFTAKLKPGKNVISVRAKVGSITSKIAKVTVTRQ